VAPPACAETSIPKDKNVEAAVITIRVFCIVSSKFSERFLVLAFRIVATTMILVLASDKNQTIIAHKIGKKSWWTWSAFKSDTVGHHTTNSMAKPLLRRKKRVPD
jgi:hypothetical protein